MTLLSNDRHANLESCKGLPGGFAVHLPEELSLINSYVVALV